jgi:predicted ABC-type exoprotein transport system permease subunit
MKNNTFSILFWGFAIIIGYIILGFALPILLAINVTAWALLLYIPIVALGIAFFGYLMEVTDEEDEDNFWYCFMDIVEYWF